MKKNLFQTAVLCIIVLFLTANFAYSKDEIKEVKIKTSAECEMCKTKIEKAVNRLTGIESSNLDVESRVLTVKYNPDKVELDKIRKAVSKAGYSADDVAADPKAYKKLPKCCQQGGHDKEKDKEHGDSKDHDHSK